MRLPSCTVSFRSQGSFSSWECGRCQFLRSQSTMSRRDCPSDVESRLRFALQQQLKFQSFREGQLEASSAVLRGTDVVLRMPTSGGKSLAYVLPCLCLPYLTIVISPLISLMNEQVRWAVLIRIFKRLGR